MSRRTLLRTNPDYKRTYGVWAAMKQRCNDPNTQSYSDYGGRGISYIARWEFFDNFLEDMGIAPFGLTLDRINNEGHYTKENCRWATRYVQAHNSRTRQDNSSGVRGVSFEKRDRNWVAHANGKCIYRGKHFEEAVKVRQAWEQSNNIWRP